MLKIKSYENPVVITVIRDYGHPPRVVFLSLVEIEGQLTGKLPVYLFSLENSLNVLNRFS